MPFITAIATAATAVFTAIGTAATTFFGAGFVGTVGKALLTVGLQLGVSAVTSLFQKTPQQKPGSVTANIQLGGDIPRQVVLGTIGVKGHQVYAHTFGASNSILQFVIIVSDGWCGPITRLRVNDITVDTTMSGSATGGKATGLVSLAPVANEIQRFGVTGFGTGGAGGGSEPSLIVQYYDGRPGQTSNAALVANSGGRLTSADRYAGMAYVIVTASQGTGNFDQIPELMIETTGYRCYDPRKDSTNGGSGAHRLADPATWEPTELPALHIYNYLIGLKTEGQVFVGPEVQAFEIDTAMFAAAANICAESVPRVSGGNELRYAASHVILADQSDHRSKMAPLLQSMAGYLVERGGTFGVIAGAAQVPAVTITDADIVWDRGVKWSGSKSRTERANEVHGQFLDPSSGWQADSYPRIQSASALTSDGERLAVQLDFAAIRSVTQAQRVAQINLRQTRREASASLTLGYHLFRLDAGDWITWTSALYQTTRTYLVASRERNPDDTVSLQLVETGNDVYSYTLADEQPYTPPAPQPTQPTLASTVSSFAVQAVVVADRSAVRCSWTPITDLRIEAVIIEYRPVGSTNPADYTRVRDDSPYDGFFVIDQPPTGVSYEFRGTINTTPPRLATWTGWVSLASIPTYAAGSIDITKLTGALQSQVDTSIDDQARITGELLSRLDGALGRKAVLDETLRAGDAAARVSDQVALQVIPDVSALASRTTSVEASLGTTNANVSGLTAALATTDAAVATAQTSLNARFGGNAATSLFRQDNVAAPTAVRSAIQIGVSATYGMTTYTAFGTWYAGTGGSGIDFSTTGDITFGATNVFLKNAAVNSGVPVPIFSVAGGKFKFDPLAQLDTDNIILSSVNSRSSSRVTSNFNLSNSAVTWQTVGVSTTITTTATDWVTVFGQISGEFDFEASSASVLFGNMLYRIVRETSSVSTVIVPDDTGGIPGAVILVGNTFGTLLAGLNGVQFSHQENPGAGTHIYRVEIRSDWAVTSYIRQIARMRTRSISTQITKR